MTYFVMNVFFLFPLLVIGLFMRKQLPWRAIFWATGALLIITAIFDNLIIGTGIVAYDEELISGIKIGLAPIEDFSYSLAGPLLVAILSKVFGIDNQEKSKR
jgi:lycopene cyclase domain-containing protein